MMHFKYLVTGYVQLYLARTDVAWQELPLSLICLEFKVYLTIGIDTARALRILARYSIGETPYCCLNWLLNK